MWIEECVRRLCLIGIDYALERWSGWNFKFRCEDNRFGTIIEILGGEKFFIKSINFFIVIVIYVLFL